MFKISFDLTFIVDDHGVIISFTIKLSTSVTPGSIITTHKNTLILKTQSLQIPSSAISSGRFFEDLGLEMRL